MPKESNKRMCSLKECGQHYLADDVKTLYKLHKVCSMGCYFIKKQRDKRK